MSHTNGTDPEDGIDIEPNVSSDGLVDVHFENNVTSDSNGDGFQMSLYAEDSSSAPVSISVIGHQDLRAAECGFHFNGNDASAFAGTISIQDSSVTDSGDYGIWPEYWRVDNPNINFKNLTVTNASHNRSPVYGTATAIAVQRGGGSSVAEGNVYFDGTSVIDTLGLIDYYFDFSDGSGVGVQNVKFVNNGTLSGASAGSGLLNGQSVQTVDVPVACPPPPPGG
jgi:hypothetical protein